MALLNYSNLNLFNCLVNITRSLEMARGRELSTAKVYKGKYEAKIEIPGGKCGYFLEPYIVLDIQDNSCTLIACALAQ